MSNVIFNRIWAMPSKNTFSIKPIGELIERYIHGKSVDPFANVNKLATITNDLDPDCHADFCMDALDFLRQIESNSIDTILFDPPYSPRQLSECYKKMEKSVNMQTTQMSFWSNLKKEVQRVTINGGISISCAWNSGGIGKKYGFKLVEILLVPHGSSRNDTIITVERKEHITLFDEISQGVQP